VRTRAGKDLGSMELDELATRLGREHASRGRYILEEPVSPRPSA
jgi:hypothetical protein